MTGWSSSCVKGKSVKLKVKIWELFNNQFSDLFPRMEHAVKLNVTSPFFQSRHFDLLNTGITNNMTSCIAANCY